MIKYLEPNENLKEIIAKGVFLVDFYADWCGPCKMMGSVLDGIQDVNIVKVNTDTHQELAREYGVMSIPTLLFFKDGTKVRQEIGFKEETEIRKIIEQL